MPSIMTDDACPRNVPSTSLWRADVQKHAGRGVPSSLPARPHRAISVPAPDTSKSEMVPQKNGRLGGDVKWGRDR